MGTVDRQLSAMHLQIISIGAVLTLVRAKDFIAPPDRIWFRQDALAEGQTCASQYEKVKDTDKVITGKGPIILPEEATFKVCIKFLAGVYRDTKTGENIERAGRDWHHDSGNKSPCAEGCCEYNYLGGDNTYNKWFKTQSDCSDTSGATEAPLYFTAEAGENGEAGEWRKISGISGACVGKCCTIIPA